MNIYQFALKTIQGQKYDTSTLKNKVVLIVNTASKCVLTPQFKELETLYQRHKGQFIILGFPCNQFASQEPLNGHEIQEFCTRNYGVTFPIMQKIDVNGPNTHPLYQYLKKEKKWFGIEAIKWNFEKFLVGRDGTVVDRFAPTTGIKDYEQDIARLIEKTT